MKPENSTPVALHLGVVSRFWDFNIDLIFLYCVVWQVPLFSEVFDCTGCSRRSVGACLVSILNFRCAVESFSGSRHCGVEVRADGRFEGHVQRLVRNKLGTVNLPDGGDPCESI